MRKITLILSLMVAMVTTAMAQIDTNKEYRIKNVNGYMTIGEGYDRSYGPIGCAQLDEYNDNQIFVFTAVDGKENTYFLKSKAGKYITYYCVEQIDGKDAGLGWNAHVSSNVADAQELTFEVKGNEYVIKGYNESKSKDCYFKTGQAQDPNTWGLVNNGMYFLYNDEENIDNAATWALEEIVPEVLVDIDVTKQYRIKTVVTLGTDSKPTNLYMTIGEGYTHTYGPVSCITLDESNDDQIFIFTAVEGKENTYLLKSQTGKYITYYCDDQVDGNGQGWNVHISNDVSKAQELTFNATGTEYTIKGYNEDKKEDRYFKIGAASEQNSNIQYVYNDANDINLIATWSLVEIETEATAIENVNVEIANDVIYDITGRRVKEITNAGIYIINGKKTFVK